MKSDKRNNGNGYETGYGKPPVSNRFKKGQSGNPKGRPKGSKSSVSAINRILRERVIINEGGRRKTVTKLDAGIKQIANKGASGDLAALRLLITLLQFMAQRTIDPPAPVDRLDEGDKKLVMTLLEGLKLDSEGGPGE